MAYYEWGRLLRIEPTSLDSYDGSANEGFIVSIRPLGQLRAPDERQHVFGRTLWQRLTRRPTVDQPAADQPVREAFVNRVQLERLPRSLAAGEMVMMVFGQQGELTALNPGHDHAHVERCVAKPGSCRSIALWTDSRASSPRPSGRLYLRTWRYQVLPELPRDLLLPPLTITDGLAIDGEVGVAATYPASLLMLPNVRTISEAGQSAILNQARQLGLLEGRTDFRTRQMPGADSSHILLSIDQQRIELVGPDPVETAADLTPVPGTPEAFGRFWQLLGSLDDWLSSELGPTHTYAPERLIVVTISPVGGRPYRPTDMKWPLERTFAELEGCATIAGDELDVLLPVLQQADGKTGFVDSKKELRWLMVRALVPGEPSPCA